VTTQRQRVQSASICTVLSLALGCIAFSAVFSKSLHVNELAIDFLGLVAFFFAVFASYLFYQLRSQMKFRLICGATVLIAVLIGIEFVGGTLWLTLDTVTRYGQKR